MEKRICAVDDCDLIEDGHSGLCKKHDTRRRRHGDPLIVVKPHERALPSGPDHPRWTGDDATYLGAHQRVRYQRGRAKDHACVDCGGPAAHWSYDRACPNEKQSELGPYSTDIAHYVPRCVRCHKRFDLAAIA